MDNVVSFDAKERTIEKAEEKEWKEDEEVVEMGMGDLSDIADGFKKIKEGLELISNATGVDLESV